MFGFVYLRDNAAFRADQVIKLGITQNIVDRATTYVTGELHRGEWLQVWQVPHRVLAAIDKKLKCTLARLHVYKGGGTEFYSRDLIQTLADVLSTQCAAYNVECTRWSAMEIENADRTARIKQMPARVKKLFAELSGARVARVIAKLRANRAKRGPPDGTMRYYGPNEQQREVLSKIDAFYTLHASGRIHWACGLGKALLGVQIVQHIGHAKQPGSQSGNSPAVLVGVPSVALQKQMAAEVRKIYPRAAIVLVNSQVGAVTLDFATAAGMVRDPVFYITTYHSSQHLVDYFKTHCITPDFKIADEYHHIAQNTEGSGFAAFDRIAARLSLYMSATPPTDDTAEASKYGPVIDTRSVRWAIDNKKITDYCVIVSRVAACATEDAPGSHSAPRLPGAPHMALACMALYPITHMLMYTNTKAEAEQVSAALTAAGFVGYNRALYSGSHSNLSSELAEFVAAERGIISCVYMFGEGFDLPRLNAVCVAAPMHSNTRIIQYLLRPNRLLKGQPDKLAHILLPSDNYESLRDIIANMRHVDQLVGDKLRVLSVSQITQASSQAVKQNLITDTDLTAKLKLRLIHSGALRSGLTAAQDEYNYVRSCVAYITSRAEYVKAAKLCPDWPEDPEDYFKITGQWVGWADFLNMSHMLSLDDWRVFCRDKKINTSTEYTAACTMYPFLPRDPGDAYPNFDGFRNEFNKKLTRR